jgi:hypothetical protein
MQEKDVGKPGATINPFEIEFQNEPRITPFIINYDNIPYTRIAATNRSTTVKPSSHHSPPGSVGVLTLSLEEVRYVYEYGVSSMKISIMHIHHSTLELWFHVFGCSRRIIDQAIPAVESWSIQGPPFAGHGCTGREFRSGISAESLCRYPADHTLSTNRLCPGMTCHERAKTRGKGDENSSKSTLSTLSTTSVSCTPSRLQYRVRNSPINQ